MAELSTSADATAAQRAQLMALLVDMEARSRASALGLPATEEHKPVWDGLVFSVAGVRVTAAMNEVAEMLQYPDFVTPVPGAGDWMLGLANIRGSLLPVVDLQRFLGAKAIVPGKATRMLVLRLRGLSVGVLVSSVQGMRHFPEEGRMSNARMKGAIGRYVFDAFSLEREIWPIFSMHALAADPEFRSAAV